MSNDFDIDTQDFNVDEADSMPSFVNEIDGIYKCDLTLGRETGERNDAPYDQLIFKFIIQETIEEKKDYGIGVDDMVYLRYSLLHSKKDIENGEKTPVGLRIAKEYLVALKEALGSGAGLSDIITNAQGVSVIATFATKESKGKNAEGEDQIYKNINLRKLIIE